MVDKDGWVVIISVVVVTLAVFAYLSTSGIIYVDWNGIFNIKEYTKTSSSSSTNSTSTVSSTSKVGN